MQKTPKATFKGQVKRGFDNWKNGRVEFYVEGEVGSWTVQLYHDVNPGRVVHRYKSLLGKSAHIVFKCNRLIIGDKSDGELHIKIPDFEAHNAQRLVKAIMSYSISTPTQNRAEVGLASSRNGFSASGQKTSKVSTLPMSEGWLSKRSPPPSYQQERNHSGSVKRKIQLESPDTRVSNSGVGRGEGQPRLSNGGSNVFDIDEDEEDDEEVTFPRFTGMKDYSKAQRSNTAVNLGKGLGPVNFYGAEKSLMTENAYRGLNRKPASSKSPSQQNGVRSPKIKRAKLSDLEDADRENKSIVKTASKALLKGALTAARLTMKAPTLSDPQEGGACGGAENDEQATNLDASGNQSDGHMVGFDNLGNTCFMNSPLQCLSSLEPLSLDIQSAICQFGPQLPPNSITKMLYLLMKDVRKLDVRPERVREILTRLRHDINGKFEYNTQQDAHELLAELLDRTDEEVKSLLTTREKTETPSESSSADMVVNSPSSSNQNPESEADQGASKPAAEDSGEIRSTPTEANFTWFYKTSFFFHECKTEVVSSQDERDTTLMLALDTNKSMNLQDCIDQYFESSEVDMRCEKCGKEEKATMTRKIVKRPRCFILTLLRYQTHNLEAKKRLDSVVIPRYMSVLEFCADDVKAAPSIDPVFMLDRVPYDASLRSEAASEAGLESTPAVEAARQGHAVAMAMASDKRKREETEWQNFGSQGRWAVENTDISGMEDANRTGGENMGRRMQVEGQEQSLDPKEQEKLTVKRLANILADQFAEVEQQVELAREANEDFTDIYTEAQGIIESSSEHVKKVMEDTYELEEGESRDSDAYRMEEQYKLSELLIEWALFGDEGAGEAYDFPRVRLKLIALRYCSVKGETARLNHLVNDLAMYLAAKKIGIVVEPDSPKRRKISPSICGGRDKNSVGRQTKTDPSSDHSYECDGERKSGPEGEGEEDCTSHGEVFMEEDSGNRGSLEVNPSSARSRSSSLGEEESEIWTGDHPPSKCGPVEASEESGDTRSRTEQSQRVAVNNSVSEKAEEDSSGGLADVSSNATVNTTNGLNSSDFDPGFVGDGIDRSLMDDPILQGRPISQWTELELQDVEIKHLSDEEMMIYAQALSRFEYEREQINHSVSSSAAAATSFRDPYAFTDFMDSCDDATAVSYDDTSTTSVQGKVEQSSGKEELEAEGAEKYPGEVSSTSGSSLSEGSDGEKDASKPCSLESKKKTGRHIKAIHDDSKRVPELHCEETLSDIDEPDCMSKDSSTAQVKHPRSGQAGSTPKSPGSGSSARSRNRVSSSEKQSKSSMQAGAGDSECCRSRDNPSSDPVDSGKVLSPHKGLSNHSNTHVPVNSSLSAAAQSSERAAHNSSHGNQSPLPQSHSPTVASMSSSSSGGSGGAKPTAGLGGRDIHMLSPAAAQLSPRRDSISQSKSARNDLARLRSPSSASPRKRITKDSPAAQARAKLGSASKRLLFEDENNARSAQNLVRRALASDDVVKALAGTNTSLTNSMLENFPMQEDLINGGLAKSEDGELADPDGIHKLLSLSKPYTLSSQSKPKGEDNQSASILSNPSSIPHPVPIGGSKQSITHSTKGEPISHSPSTKSKLTQILTEAPRDEGNQHPSPSLKTIMESAAPSVKRENLEDLLDGQRAESVPASPRQKPYRPQADDNDEKENMMASSARRERLESIHMGKADCSYRLVGIVNHHGDSLFAGHYTAFSFNFNKQRWHLMDDNHTKGTSEQTARTQSAQSGYVFFYMDKDIFDQYAQKVLERPQKRGSTS